MPLRRYISLMLANNATLGNFKTDFTLGNFSFFYYPSYVQLSGKIPSEIAKEICKTNFFHKSLFLSINDRNLALEDCITNPYLKTGLLQYAEDMGVLNFDYDKYCSNYEQYKKKLIDISKENGEELYIENLYFTSLSSLKFVLNLLKSSNLLPKGISN